jgi:hypothetical protein
LAAAKAKNIELQRKKGDLTKIDGWAVKKKRRAPKETTSRGRSKVKWMICV